MENIKEYGDLSEKELLAFLAEIMAEDEEMQEEETAVAESVEEENMGEVEEVEELGLLDSVIMQNREIYAKEMFESTFEQKSQDSKKYHAEKRLLKTRIQRAAFDQSELPLTQEVTNEDIKLLIEALTEDQVKLMRDYEVYISKRVTTLLRYVMPRYIRDAMRRCPRAVRKCPGFLYRALDENGNIKTFFVKPDVPYYFEQGTEMDQIQALRTQKPELIATVDKRVVRYHELRETLFRKEVAIAAAFRQRHIHTFFDLLRCNVVWFNRLYTKVTGQFLKFPD